LLRKNEIFGRNFDQEVGECFLFTASKSDLKHLRPAIGEPYDVGGKKNAKM